MLCMVLNINNLFINWLYIDPVSLARFPGQSEITTLMLALSY